MTFIFPAIHIRQYDVRIPNPSDDDRATLKQVDNKLDEPEIDAQHAESMARKLEEIAQTGFIHPVRTLIFLPSTYGYLLKDTDLKSADPDDRAHFNEHCATITERAFHAGKIQPDHVIDPERQLPDHELVARFVKLEPITNGRPQPFYDQTTYTTLLAETLVTVPIDLSTLVDDSAIDPAKQPRLRNTPVMGFFSNGGGKPSFTP